MDFKKATRVIGAVGLVAILNSPVKMASQQIMFQPYVIEQDITDKKMTEKEKHYYELSQAFHDSDLVFKGKCIDVSIAYCGAVGDLCTNYVFETDTFYKHSTIDGFRKDPVKHRLSLFYDVAFPIGSTSRFERAIMNGGGNGDLYEPTDTGIMAGDELIVFAKKKDLKHNEFFVKYYCHNTKKNNKALDEIVKGPKKVSFK